MLRGAAKGERDRLVTLAHQSAAMMALTHTKEGLRPLAHYLKPPPTKGADDGAAVLDMMRRFKARQDKKG